MTVESNQSKEVQETAKQVKQPKPWLKKAREQVKQFYNKIVASLKAVQSNSKIKETANKACQLVVVWAKKIYQKVKPLGKEIATLVTILKDKCNRFVLNYPDIITASILIGAATAVVTSITPIDTAEITLIVMILTVAILYAKKVWLNNDQEESQVSKPDANDNAS